MNEVILVLNTGSSSIKFALFTHTSMTLIYRGKIEAISENPQFIVLDSHHRQLLKEPIESSGYKPAVQHLFAWLDQLTERITLKTVGHRVVHGGTYFGGPTRITADVIKKIESLNPLAPIHQPLSLDAIKIIMSLYPKLMQVACFDTTFHHTQYQLAKLFAIPRELTLEGIVRYGFHGLSYEYIASVLSNYIQDKADGNVIVAHLGNGASMCAMNARKSVATSMGFSTLDGLMMGTRCGTIDPGVILYLIQEKKMSVEHVSHMLYQESGLLGVSNKSCDIRELQSSVDPHAVEAIDLFCYRAATQLSSLCVALQGCDAIIFTAGIGEHSAPVRKKICDQLQWLGIVLDEHANNKNASIISQGMSKILVGVIPTDEEYMIALHIHRMDRSD